MFKIKVLHHVDGIFVEYSNNGGVIMSASACYWLIPNTHFETALQDVIAKYPITLDYLARH